jgi:hypothetical protein
MLLGVAGGAVAVGALASWWSMAPDWEAAFVIGALLGALPGMVVGSVLGDLAAALVKSRSIVILPPTNWLTLAVVSKEGARVEVECRIALCGWLGLVRTFTTPEHLLALVWAAEEFGQTQRGPIVWTAGGSEEEGGAEGSPGETARDDDRIIPRLSGERGEGFRHPTGWDPGCQPGAGLIELRFDTLEGSGRICCHVRLGLEGIPDQQLEGNCRFTGELHPDAESVIAFARELHRVAVERQGQAVLPGANGPAKNPFSA